MKNLATTIIRNALFLVSLSIFILSGCNKELTAKRVEKDLKQARKATHKAQVKTKDAIESRKQLYMENRQAHIDEMDNRIEQIDERLRSLKDISSTSPNQNAVTNVDAAIINFNNERDSLTREIDRFKAIRSPNWDASINGINNAIERIENELNMIEKTVENK